MSEPVVSRYIWVDTGQKDAWLHALYSIPHIMASPCEFVRMSRGEEILVDKTLIQVWVDTKHASEDVTNNASVIEHAIESIGVEVSSA